MRFAAGFARSSLDPIIGQAGRSLAVTENRDDPGRIGLGVLVRPQEVERVAPLAALVEGPELGREQLVELVRVNDRAVADRQVRDDVQAGHDMPEVLMAADLDLDLPNRTGLRREAEGNPWVPMIASAPARSSRERGLQLTRWHWSGREGMLDTNDLPITMRLAEPPEPFD